MPRSPEMRMSGAPTPPSEPPPRRHEELSSRYQEYRGLGSLILGGTGFNVEFSDTVDTFMFRFDTRTVVVSTKLIEKRKLGEKEQRYIFGHEVAHFVQLLQDPEGMIGTFETAKEKAAKAPEHLQDDVRTAWDGYFNVMLDIHDNAINERRVPTFQGAANPRPELYERLVRPDLVGDPYNQQFIFAALKHVMDPEHPPVVDEPVRKILERPFQRLGKSYASLYEYIASECFNGDLSVTEVLYKAKTVIQPHFEALIAEDIKRGKVLSSRPDGGSPDLNGDGLSEKDMKDAAESIKRNRESAKDKAKRKAQEDLGKSQSGEYSDREQKIMQRIREASQPVFNEITDAWKAFIQIARDTHSEMQSGFLRGAQINVPDLVRDTTLLTGEGRGHFYERRVENVIETRKPKKIIVMFQVDLSGSMDETKRKAVQEAIYTLSQTLLNCVRSTNAEYQNIHDDAQRMEVGLMYKGYGSTTANLFPASGDEARTGAIDDKDPARTNKRMWDAIFRVNTTDLGGTEDAPSLQHALDFLQQPNIREELEAGLADVVVLQITDGETSTALESTRLVSELNSLSPHVFCRGIQIPGSNVSEAPRKPDPDGHTRPPDILPATGTFSQVWKSAGIRLDHLHQLAPGLKKILFEEVYKRSAQ